jgi:hypothetical protein
LRASPEASGHYALWRKARDSNSRRVELFSEAATGATMRARAT